MSEQQLVEFLELRLPAWHHTLYRTSCAPFLEHMLPGTWNIYLNLKHLEVNGT